MKKLFGLLLLFTGVGLFADTTFYAYSKEQVQTFSDLLTYLSFFFDKGSDTGSTYLSLLKFIVLFGTLVTTVNMAKDFNSKNPNASHSSLFDFVKYQIFVIGMLSVLYGTYDNVVVTDPASGETGVSAEIPLIFAKTIGFFSEFEYKMTDIAEYAFKDIRSPSSGWEIQNYGTSGLGYGGVADGTTLAGLMTLKNLDMNKAPGVTKDISPMFSELLTECVVTPLSSNGGNDNPSDLFYSNNIMQKIQDIFDAHTNIKDIPLSKVYYGDDTCEKLWDDTKSIVNKYVGDINDTMLKERKANKFMSALAYSLYMHNKSDASNLIADASKAKQALMQVMLGNETNNLFNKLGVAGNIYSAGANKSLAEVQYTGMGVAMMMQKYLPLLSFMLFAIMTGAFPFIFAFALLPGGYKSIINYVKTLAWVSLWGPMAAILNFFVDRRLGEIYSQVTASGDYTTLLEPAHIVADISSAGGEMAGLAGMLFLSVPGLSWMLVSGSGVMLGNIAGIIGGSFTKNISPDAVMQDATQLEAAKQASIQMDKRVGVAEMAEFAARRQAATEGGMYAGARKAMMQGGFGMSEFGTMAEVQSASEIGQSAAFANQVGNGTNAARAGAIQGAQAGAQTMATANTIGSTSNAAMIGTITGTQAASAALAHARKIGSTEEAARVGRVEGGAKAGGEIGQANAYGGSVDAAFDTNRKAALGSELQKRKHFQELSDDQVATNAAHRGFLSGRTDANLADKLSSDPSMFQKEVYQAEVNANKEVSQFDSADTAVRGLAKKSGISLNKAKNAVATVARNSAATQIASDTATALGEKNAIGGSLASAMMTNSVEMGLWGGMHAGADALHLKGQSLKSEEIMSTQDSNTMGVGKRIGERQEHITNLSKAANQVKQDEIALEALKNKKYAERLKYAAKTPEELAQKRKTLDNFMEHKDEIIKQAGKENYQKELHQLEMEATPISDVKTEMNANQAQISAAKQKLDLDKKNLNAIANAYNPRNAGANSFIHTLNNSVAGSIMRGNASNFAEVTKLQNIKTRDMGEGLINSKFYTEDVAHSMARGELTSMLSPVTAAYTMGGALDTAWHKVDPKTRAILSELGGGSRNPIDRYWAFNEGTDGLSMRMTTEGGSLDVTYDSRDNGVNTFFNKKSGYLGQGYLSNDLMNIALNANPNQTLDRMGKAGYASTTTGHLVNIFEGVVGAKGAGGIMRKMSTDGRWRQIGELGKRVLGRKAGGGAKIETVPVGTGTTTSKF